LLATLAASTPEKHEIKRISPLQPRESWGLQAEHMTG